MVGRVSILYPHDVKHAKLGTERIQDPHDVKHAK